MSNFVTDVMTKNQDVIDKDPVNAEHIINTVRRTRETGTIVIPGKMRMRDAEILIEVLQKSLLIRTNLTGIPNDPESMIKHIAKANVNWSFDTAMKYIKIKSPYFNMIDPDRLETIWNNFCSRARSTLIFA